MNEKGRAGCEGATCVMARHLSEKYRSKIHQPLERLVISNMCKIKTKVLCRYYLCFKAWPCD
jgi:hypothetical protein